MDSKRFDNISRALASGASRRSLIKGLLGIGGAAAATTVATDGTSARRRGGITTPTTSAPTTTTSSPDPTCVEGFTCGLDCCTEAVQCCDGECCPDGTVCLTVYYGGEIDGIEEETCCAIPNLCDADTNGKCCAETEECCSVDGCCDGECFDPSAVIPAADGEPFCCPVPFVVCQNQDGSETCIDPETQCCADADCPGIAGQGEEACWNCVENTCVAEERGALGDCPECEACGGAQLCVADATQDGGICQGELGVCCSGTCITDESQFFCPSEGACCLSGQVCCTNDGCCDGDCDQIGLCCDTTTFVLCGGTCCEPDRCTTENFCCASGFSACGFECCSNELACCFGDDCSDLRSDPDNCGDCGNECLENESCVDGVCVCVPESPAQTCGSEQCATLQNNCGQDVDCSQFCQAPNSCSDGVCDCERDIGICNDRCGTITDNCGDLVNCGETCTVGSCVGTDCICDANFQCSGCGPGECCDDVPYCNTVSGGGTNCESCVRTISACQCTGSGGNDNCCAGLVCVEGLCVSCVANGQQCSAAGQVCCGSAISCTASGQTCPNPV